MPAIIMGFRRHRIVITSDIRQIFRNILVHPDDHNLQSIYWRSDDRQSCKYTGLPNVTYGITSLPFLAIRVVKQLIKDESSREKSL